MRYCEQCGAELDENAKFCGSCGNPANESQPAPLASSESKPKGRNPIGWIAVVIILLAAGVFGAMNWDDWFPSDTADEDTNEQSTTEDDDKDGERDEKDDEDEDDTDEGDEATDGTELTNSEYGFSIDLGDAADNISEVPTDIANALDSYAYCYELEPSDPDLGDSDTCGQGSVNIFTIQVMDEEQYDMFWGELLGQAGDYYFVYSHMNGFPPESLPVGFFEDVADSFALDRSLGTDVPDVIEDDAKLTLRDLSVSSSIVYDDLLDIEFDWYVAESMDPSGMITLSGKVLSAADAEVADDDINEFFEDEGFEPDFYNAADGAIGSLVGFQKDNVVCQILRMYAETDEELEDPDYDFSTFDVEISCGELPQ